MNTGAPASHDVHATVLAAVGMLGSADEQRIADILQDVAHFAQLGPSARLVQVQHWLGVLRSEGLACQGWADRWKLTRSGTGRLRAAPCSRCSATGGWCSCQ